MTELVQPKIQVGSRAESRALIVLTFGEHDGTGTRVYVQVAALPAFLDYLEGTLPVFLWTAGSGKVAWVLWAPVCFDRRMFCRENEPTCRFFSLYSGTKRFF